MLIVITVILFSVIVGFSIAIGIGLLTMIWCTSKEKMEELLTQYRERSMRIKQHRKAFGIK